MEPLCNLLNKKYSFIMLINVFSLILYEFKLGKCDLEQGKSI